MLRIVAFQKKGKDWFKKKKKSGKEDLQASFSSFLEER